MSDSPQLGSKLTQLAEKILDELLCDASEASLPARIDALKAISTLHLGLEKLAGRMPHEDGGETTTFSSLRRRVQETTGE